MGGSRGGGGWAGGSDPTLENQVAICYMFFWKYSLRSNQTPWVLLLLEGVSYGPLRNTLMTKTKSFQDPPCADPDVGKGVQPPPTPPLKNHKNIRSLSNTGPDPLENH